MSTPPLDVFSLKDSDKRETGGQEVFATKPTLPCREEIMSFRHGKVGFETSFAAA